MGGADLSPIVTMAEVQAFVRLESGDEEALLAGLIRTASALCETFLNQVVIARPFAESVDGSGSWQRLVTQPVQALTTVKADGLALANVQFALDIDASGAGWVRLPRGARCVLEGLAGMAASQNEVPEPIRQGVVRLTSHLFSNRDSERSGEPPAIVTALWRPYRRLVLA